VLLTLDPDALVAARIVGTLRRRRVVADVHEDYARLVLDRNWPLGVTALGARVVVGVATHAARTSALTLVSDDHVPPLRARERFILRNEADGHLVGGPGPPGDTPRACYVGDVRPSRGLFTMLDAVAASPPWTLDVVGPVRSSDRTEMERRCAEPDLVGRVIWHGRQPPVRAWSVVEGAWVGFALLDDTPAFRDALPSKVYEYLAKGILPVVSDLPRQRQLLREVGAGVVVRDAEDAASALHAYASDPQRRRAEMRAAVSWTRQREDASAAYDRAAARVEAVLARD
jgi:glycosyltransferase involved in cell wall biosynthesis